MDAAVTVLMAMYNDAAYLPTAIESILAQTHREFRFLIVDDCSTDGSSRIARSYRDPRIEVLRLERNVGQTAALNIGLRRAATPWVARMDADDYSAPERLGEQMRALGRTPGIQCVGTAIWEFRQDPKVREKVIARPAEHPAIQRAVLHGSGMIHGSIVVGREALLECGAYDERYRYASDRDMFIRLFRKFQAMNLQAPLLGVRRHPGQDSFSKIAADEYIEIFERLLSGGGYAGQEREILRRSLAYSHLFRGRCLRHKGNWPGWAADQAKAIGISPIAWARNAAGTLGERLPLAGFRDGRRKEFWS